MPRIRKSTQCSSPEDGTDDRPIFDRGNFANGHGNGGMFIPYSGSARLLSTKSANFADPAIKERLTELSVETANS